MANKFLTSKLILRTVQPRRFLSATSSLWLPKYTELRLPALSPTMEQGNILEWNLKEGDEFQEADSLAEVETDKATVAWELQGDEGYIAKLFMPEGSKNVKVGTLVGIFVENEGDVAAFKNVSLEEIEGGAVSQTSSAPAETPVAASAPVSAASSYPKHKMMTLPALSPTMETGTIIAWNKKVGDEVADGDAIAEIETDKATVTFEVFEEGYIAKIFLDEGAKDVKVGTPMLVICEEEADIAKFSDYVASADSGSAPVEAATPAAAPAAPTPTPAAAAAPPASQTPAPTTTPAATQQPGGRIKISPLASMLVASEGVDLAHFLANSEPTGSMGRFREKDVHNYIAKLKAGEFQQIQTDGAAAVPVSSPGPQVVMDASTTTPTSVQPPRAGRSWTLQSKQTIPHYYLTSDVNLSKVDELCEKLNALSKSDSISRNDLILKAVGLACKKIPDTNSEWLVDENIIRQVMTVNIELANDNHLYNVNNLGLSEISNKSNAENHRDPGSPTFSVYSFIDSQISSAGSIIKPGQACALTIGGSRKEVQLTSEGGLIAVDLTSVTLSCDHRLVDGAVGAEWLKWFKIYLEEPMMMLL